MKRIFWKLKEGKYRKQEEIKEINLHNFEILKNETECASNFKIWNLAKEFDIEGVEYYAKKYRDSLDENERLKSHSKQK